MPTSNLAVAPHVINLVETVLPHDRVLDVGPGWGKYAVLLREYLNVKPTLVDAVEAWAPYVDAHRLLRLYDRVWYGAAGDDTWRLSDDVEVIELTDGTGRLVGHGFEPVYGHDGAVDAVDALTDYDTVLMVDVIEHMPEAAAVRFLGQCPHARAVICTPVEFFDNGPGLPPTEEHVSHWTPASLKSLAYALGRPLEHLGTQHGALLARLGPAR